MRILETGLAIISFVSALTAGATVTLYDVASTGLTTNVGPDPMITVSFGTSYTLSPISTRDDGKTVYQEVLVITDVVDNLPSTTRIDTSGYPQTYTLTRVEDANGFEQTVATGSANLAIAAQSCSFQGTTQGVCVESFVLGTTIVITYTGVPTPVFTVTQSSGGSPRWIVPNAALGSVICLVVSLVAMGAILAL